MRDEPMPNYTKWLIYPAILFVGILLLLRLGVDPRADIGVWGFLVIVVLCSYAYKFYCVHHGIGTHGRHAATGANAVDRQRLDQIDERMKAMEATLADLKRETESLAEDYRFIQRVLDGGAPVGPSRREGQ